MNHVIQLQTLMYNLGYFNGKIDGVWGAVTQKAYEEVLYATSDRSITEADKEEVIYSNLPELTLQDQGLSLVDLDGNVALEAILPAYTTAQMTAAFGKMGTRVRSMPLPYPMRLAWDKSVTVNSTMVHFDMEEPLTNVLNQTLEHYSLAGLQELGLDLYGGCFNIRKMTGGKEWSSHSWGVGVDINPEGNPFRMNPSKTTFVDPQYTEFARIMISNGFRTLPHDLMHWQLLI